MMIMRTTVTLDEDVASRLESLMRTTGKRFKQAVNDALRAGLDALLHPSAPAKPFKVKARPLGLPPGMSYDSVGELLEQLEGSSHR